MTLTDKPATITIEFVTPGHLYWYDIKEEATICAATPETLERVGYVPASALEQARAAATAADARAERATAFGDASQGILERINARITEAGIAQRPTYLERVNLLIADRDTLRAQLATTSRREPTREEMEIALGVSDEAFLGGTIRRCIDCREPVFGGPTRCTLCVARGSVVDANKRATAAERDLTCARENQSRAAEQVAAAEKRAAKAEAALEAEREHVRQVEGHQNVVVRTAIQDVQKELRTATAKLAAWGRITSAALAWYRADDSPSGDSGPSVDTATKWLEEACDALPKELAPVPSDYLSPDDDDSLPTAHRPGEAKDGITAECEGCPSKSMHDDPQSVGWRFDEKSSAWTCPVCASKLDAESRRLPVAPADLDLTTKTITAPTVAAGAAHATNVVVPVAPAETCGECVGLSGRWVCMTAESTHCGYHHAKSDPACPAFARRGEVSNG